MRAPWPRALTRDGPRRHSGRGGRLRLWLAAPLVVATAVVAAGSGTASSTHRAASAAVGSELGWTAPTPSTTSPPPTVTLLLFWGQGCDTCAKEKKLLATLSGREPRLRVEEFEVWHDADNRERLEREAASRGVSAFGVPTTFLGGRVWVGFTDEIGRSIEQAVAAALAGRAAAGGVTSAETGARCDLQAGQPCPIAKDSSSPETSVRVPFVGTVDVRRQSLVLSTLVIGALDGINPCSLWVISILLAMVLRTGSRGRVLAVGSTFLFVTAALYAVYMAGIYSALTVITMLVWIRVAVAGIAGAFGVINVKDYFWYKQGPSLTIRDSSKPKMYRRMRGVASGESLPAALAATVALAAGVSLLETPCTAGFPVLWTSLLSANHVSFAESAGLFILYMIPFLLDEIAVFVVAVVTMRAARVQERHGRLLKLVGGSVMLALAIVMLVDYEFMNSVLGAVAVFGTAIATAAVVHVTLSRRSRGQEEPAGRLSVRDRRI